MGSRSPDVIVDGEVIEADPPHKLVQTWRMVMDAEDGGGGVHAAHLRDRRGTRAASPSSRVIHELEGAPKLAAMVAGGQEDMGAGGGWAWVLSDLKSLLETGARWRRRTT